jgi:hypothetical protein
MEKTEKPFEPVEDRFEEFMDNNPALASIAILAMLGSFWMVVWLI